MYDRATIELKAGKGGDGSASLRREKYVPKGGPDGGDGGRGGSVYIEADPSVNTLLAYRYKRHFKAESGGPGQKQKRHGKSGQDLTLPVPVGTIVEDADTGALIADLATPGERALIARAGRGGLGNTHFATSTYQTPRFAERGEPGEERRVRLELKLLADVALVGFPNAGKSTLLSSISAARPKIADYPFTTLEPQLGVVAVPGTDGEESFVVADIPGLIEGAHEGVGLGDEFLRHIERTRVLLYVLDGSGQEGRSPLADLGALRRELELYQPELARKPCVIAFNKLDLPDARERWVELREELDGYCRHTVATSGVARIGLDDLLLRLAETLREAPPVARFVPEQAAATLRPVEVDAERYEIRRKGVQTWQVNGPSIERIAVMTDLENVEAVQRLEREMDRLGLTSELEGAGVEAGHTVRLGRVEILWGGGPPERGSRRLTRKERIARRLERSQVGDDPEAIRDPIDL
jgi:GTP-binding protein